MATFLVTGCSTPPHTYDTPQAAVDSLVGALRINDETELKRVLGSDADELLNSGDEVADARSRADFLQDYDEKHALTHEAGVTDVMTLEVGKQNWPMPIPLVNDGKGWYFDTAAGMDEVLSRRIGRNELFTIQVCLAIVDAEREYASKDYAGDGLLQYAARINSDPGTKNGLYWPVAAGEPDSPLGELVAMAAAEGYSRNLTGEPRAFHGYYYRILTEQGPNAPGGEMTFLAGEHMIGGFGVVAWPADYGNSGLKTFIVSHHGVVYERDLGNNTDHIARTMHDFNPGSGWEPSDTTDVLSPADASAD